MITTQHKVMSLVVLALISVLALVGCNSGSPPMQILLNVAGQVLLLQDSGAVGQAGVTVRLTPRDGSPAIDILVAANGTFSRADVPAGEYGIAVIVPAGVNVQAPVLADVDLDGVANAQINLPPIYVIEKAPNPPAL